MKSILFTALLALASSSAFAADAAAAAPAKKPLSAQQQKMKDCNADAKTKALKGAERKTFMKSCLSGGGAEAAAPAAAAPAAAAPSPKAAQQEKMKSCNAEAKTKGLSGTDRKSFMSTCLKG